MKSHSPRLSAIEPSPVLLGSLYTLEFSALLTAMAFYKKGDRSLLAFLSTPFGFVSLIAVFGLVISALVIVHLLRKDCWPGTKRFSATLALNLCSVVLVLATTEIVIRVFVVNSVEGSMFADTLLLPRSWESIAARNRAILAKASAQGSYLIYDYELGWTVGPNRRSKDYNRDFVQKARPELRRRYPPNYPDDIYLSSVEGIRSPRAGITFAEVPARRRIAIVGDSFTFGLEVPYEQTWGHQLESMLGPGTQVLNFGVDGYGVDQAYLRYQRDVLSWRPDIVIFGMIEDDFRRTMGVYGFLNFPGGQMPFPKPRFAVRKYGLVPLNLPLPTPDTIFANKSITELPFIVYDRSFQSAEWEWRFYHYAYSIRFLLSRFPRWSVPGRGVCDEAMKSVNGELLRSFVRLTHEQGSTPMVVYFPGRSDFVDPQAGWTRVARQVFQTYGIPYLDMTGCVSQVSPDERFVVLHYSATTNAAVANCLRDSLHGALRE